MGLSEVKRSPFWALFGNGGRIVPGFGGLRGGGKVGVLGGLYRGGLRYILKIWGRPGIF
jgi:hypothetical protein